MKGCLKTIVLIALLSICINGYSTETIIYSPQFDWMPNSQFLILGSDIPDKWIIEKLNVSTGIFETIIVLTNCSQYYIRPYIDSTHMLMFANPKYEYSINVISLSSGKILGKFTLDVSSGTNWDDWVSGKLNFSASPDGTRLAVAYIPDEQKDCNQNIAIFDLKTYKLINTLYNMELDRFSSDGKLLYAHATPIENYLYIINPFDGKIVSQLSIHSIDPTIYRGAKGVSGWWYVKDGMTFPPKTRALALRVSG